MKMCFFSGAEIWSYTKVKPILWDTLWGKLFSFWKWSVCLPGLFTPSNHATEVVETWFYPKAFNRMEDFSTDGFQFVIFQTANKASWINRGSPSIPQTPVNFEVSGTWILHPGSQQALQWEIPEKIVCKWIIMGIIMDNNGINNGYKWLNGLTDWLPKSEWTRTRKLPVRPIGDKISSVTRGLQAVRSSNVRAQINLPRANVRLTRQREYRQQWQDYKQVIYSYPFWESLPFWANNFLCVVSAKWYYMW